MTSRHAEQARRALEADLATGLAVCPPEVRERVCSLVHPSDLRHLRSCWPHGPWPPWARQLGLGLGGYVQRRAEQALELAALDTILRDGARPQRAAAAERAWEILHTIEVYAIRVKKGETP